MSTTKKEITVAQLRPTINKNRNARHLNSQSPYVNRHQRRLSENSSNSDINMSEISNNCGRIVVRPKPNFFNNTSAIDKMFEIDKTK